MEHPHVKYSKSSKYVEYNNIVPASLPTTVTESE